ncbi:MAG: hypothetical protein ACFFAH_00080 [Promethearchaeota archaeon]
MADFYSSKSGMPIGDLEKLKYIQSEYRKIKIDFIELSYWDNDIYVGREKENTGEKYLPQDFLDSFNFSPFKFSHEK